MNSWLRTQGLLELFLRIAMVKLLHVSTAASTPSLLFPAAHPGAAAAASCWLHLTAPPPWLTGASLPIPQPVCSHQGSPEKNKRLYEHFGKPNTIPLLSSVSPWGSPAQPLKNSLVLTDPPGTDVIQPCVALLLPLPPAQNAVTPHTPLSWGHNYPPQISHTAQSLMQLPYILWCLPLYSDANPNLVWRSGLSQQTHLHRLPCTPNCPRVPACLSCQVLVVEPANSSLSLDPFFQTSQTWPLQVPVHMSAPR